MRIRDLFVKPMAIEQGTTNADHYFRNRTDLELAKLLYKADYCPVTYFYTGCPHMEDGVDCRECIYEWLRSEAT